MLGRVGVLLGALAAFAPDPLLPGKPYVLRGHTQAITALAFSPDGERLATASRDQQVMLWSLASGQPVLTISGAEEQVNALAFSPDGKRLAIGETALKLRVIGLPGGEKLNELAHPDSVSALAFSPDGSQLAVCGQQNSGAVYLLATGKARYQFRGRSAQFSRDGTSLLVGSGAGSLAVLDARTGKVRTSVSTAPHEPFASWSADGATIASWSGDEPDVRLWTPGTLAPGGVLKGPSRVSDHPLKRPRLVGLALSADGKALLTGAADGFVRLWSLESRTVTGAWPAEQVAVVALSPGWIAAGDGPLVKLWRR
jgi:WD40 repeat protein